MGYNIPTKQALNPQLNGTHDADENSCRELLGYFVTLCSMRRWSIITEKRTPRMNKTVARNGYTIMLNSMGAGDDVVVDVVEKEGEWECGLDKTVQGGEKECVVVVDGDDEEGVFTAEESVAGFRDVVE
ncbi:hypothetical protein HK102_003283 [Quaeritorhiza haematococci]|nr:hypothetical protein HK102_003283 [Quaeritorhiza haematococci]